MVLFIKEVEVTWSWKLPTFTVFVKIEAFFEEYVLIREVIKCSVPDNRLRRSKAEFFLKT
jgi:hypothetical protein